MKILIVVNGRCKRIIDYLPKDFFKNFNKIVCTDGGLNNLYKINRQVVPDYIFGDFDSADDETLLWYKNKKATILKKNDQDKTDLSFAIDYLLNKYKNIDEIVVLCGTGNRFDHTICNILSFKDIDVKSKIIGDNEEVYLLKDKLELKNVKGKTISIIPITDIKNINYKGLKWPLDNMDLAFGFVGGISNIAKENTVEITLTSGIAMVVVNFSV